MKKVWSKLLVTALAVSMCFFVFACGEKPGDTAKMGEAYGTGYSSAVVRAKIKVDGSTKTLTIDEFCTMSNYWGRLQSNVKTEVSEAGSGIAVVDTTTNPDRIVISTTSATQTADSNPASYTKTTSEYAKNVKFSDVVVTGVPGGTADRPTVTYFYDVNGTPTAFDATVVTDQALAKKYVDAMEAGDYFILKTEGDKLVNDDTFKFDDISGVTKAQRQSKRYNGYTMSGSAKHSWLEGITAMENFLKTSDFTYTKEQIVQGTEGDKNFTINGVEMTGVTLKNTADYAMVAKAAFTAAK